MFYDRDEKEKGEDDISYNMNVGILVYKARSVTSRYFFPLLISISLFIL